MNMKNKKGKNLWIWILIILILIALAIGIYFWMNGDPSSIVSGASSIPQPPALPSG